MLKPISLNENSIKILIGLSITVTLILMCFSIVPDHDPILYGNIAKHIALSNDWIHLIFNQADWLDKPHFPFWMTAISFKCFGLSSFSYFLPGVLFHYIGAYYTYRLSKHLFNHQVAILSVLFYVSAFHLLNSCIDLKAEAYLLGEIIPACFYWLHYYEEPKIRVSNLLLGAFFTALALMTKGLFTVVTIFGGVGALCFYDWFRMRSGHPDHQKSICIIKWLVAFGVTLVLITPEFVALYLQFDLHPEKVVFHHTHVSGIKWFFWDSQIGRFFQTGPIHRHVSAYHYFFFIHAFLWSFLPWSLLFLIAIYRIIRSFFVRHLNPHLLHRRRASVFLFGSFVPTFCMFSLSSFQLEHYTNIIIPFAAIMSADWIDQVTHHFKKQSDYSSLVTHIFNAQVIIAIVLTLLIVLLDVLIFKFVPLTLGFMIIVVGAMMLVFSTQPILFKAIVYPTIAILLVFVFHMAFNRMIYLKYDAGYQMAQYLHDQPVLPMMEYRIKTWTFSFHAPHQLPRLIHDAQSLQQTFPYYLVLKKKDLSETKLKKDQYRILLQTKGMDFLTKPFVIIRYLRSPSGLTPPLTDYLLIRVNELSIGNSPGRSS